MIAQFTKLSVGIVLGLAAFFIAMGGLDWMLRLRTTPPYDLIAVEDGRKLHVLCEGPRDAPLVIYDAGAFGIYTDGWWIKEQLKSDHRVCLYDRAGMGWSDAVPKTATPDPDWHVEDLRRLRRALGHDAPFVLIGHSMAGLRLHAYANAYPQDLRGLIFVDAARPQNMNMDRAARIVPWMMRAMHISAGLARIGLAGGLSYIMPDELDLPRLQKRDKRRSIAAVRHHKATRAEIAAAVAAWPGASWQSETIAETLPVFVFSNSVGGGANGAVATAAIANTGIGGITDLPDETHVSLLNAVNAQKIAAAVRTITGRARNGQR